MKTNERKKITIIWIIAVIILATLIINQKPIRKFFMEREKVNEIYTGKNSLRTEEWFERQYQEIEKQKSDLIITSNELKNNSSESLKNSYYAQMKILNALIAEYNSKMNSSKYEEFANKYLPQSIEMITEIK